MMRHPVIAFKGRAGAGKSTAAEHMHVKHRYIRTSFAEPLRDMMRAIGVPEEQMRGASKEQTCAKLSGRTPREAMQMLGTEWGRALHPDFWVNLWRDWASDILDQDGYGVVVDDCRFPNEAAAVRALGGIVVDIVRPSLVSLSVGIVGHVSEKQDFSADVVIMNDGYRSDFGERISELLSNPARESSCSTAL